MTAKRVLIENYENDFSIFVVCSRSSANRRCFFTLLPQRAVNSFKICGVVKL